MHSFVDVGGVRDVGINSWVWESCCTRGVRVMHSLSTTKAVGRCGCDLCGLACLQAMSAPPPPAPVPTFARSPFFVYPDDVVGALDDGDSESGPGAPEL